MSFVLVLSCNSMLWLNKALELLTNAKVVERPLRNFCVSFSFKFVSITLSSVLLAQHNKKLIEAS